MARSKAKRVAARQTQLGQRKKKQPRTSVHSSIIKATQPPLPTVQDIPESSQTTTHRNISESPIRKPIPHNTNQRLVRSVATNYVGREIRRIAVTSTIVLAVLLVLTFVLR